MEPNKLIPNSTQIPNIVLDFLLPALPETEGKCLLYICRRTYGFHKDEDRISLTQFTDGITDRSGKILDNGTGLSRPSVVEGLKNLINAGAVAIEKNRNGNVYKIRLDMDIDKVVKNINQLRKLTSSSKKSLPKPVKLFNTQKKEKQSETKIIADGKPSAHQQFIQFFYDTTRQVRGITPIITGKDGKNLKRVLELDLLSNTELQQITLYFLANYYYQKFSPSISTFLSAGILNGLIDTMRNRPTFWQEIEQYTQTYFQSKEVQRSNDIVKRLALLKETLLKMKVIS